MSNFECKLSDLNNTPVEEIKSSSKASVLSKEENKEIPEKITRTELFQNFLNEKNGKIILLITFVHFILHSEQVTSFISVNLPSLISCTSQLNSLGKLLVGILIGVVFIMYSFFFQDR
jgi:uncharacterized membrane protein